jgi:hypothetical protein
LYYFSDKIVVKESKKVIALKLLALKVAAHLNWNLNVLLKKWVLLLPVKCISTCIKNENLNSNRRKYICIVKEDVDVNEQGSIYPTLHLDTN